MMNKKNLQTTTIATVLLLAISTCFIACHKQPACDTIRIGVLDGPSAVSFIQLMNKEVEVDGKKLELAVKNEPLQIQAMMLKNELDFAVLPTVMAANLYNKGAKYRMIACPIWGTLYILSNDEAIRTLYDLAGEEIAVFGKGTTADVLAKRLIKKERLGCKGIDYRFNSNQETAHALQSGKTKIAVVSEPLASRLLDENPGIHIVGKLNCRGAHADDSPKNHFVQSAFVVSEDFIKNHPQQIAAVCNLYMNSCNFINNNPGEAAELMVQYGMAQDKSAALRSIDLCNIQYVAAFAFVRELYHYLHICYEENPESTGGKLPDSDFIFQNY